LWGEGWGRGEKIVFTVRMERKENRVIARSEATKQSQH
jgi:hypothetical protein